MKLPKSYIKKYGGINKKAWKAYKATLKTKTKGKSSKSTKKNNPKKKGGNTGFDLNFGGGLGKGIAIGVVAGIANRFIPVNIAGADLIIAGIVMKDKTVQKIGAITLGRNLSSSLTGMLGGGGNGNGVGGGF